MKTKFSKGPWRLFPPSVDPDKQWHVTDAGDTMVIRCFGFNCDPNDKACEHNARLVSAAPELLEALHNLLADTQHSKHKCDDPDCPVEAARAVIAKAIGAKR